MILRKLWRAIMAQFNKVANFFRGIDPIAEMQYECDRAADQMKEGRQGLEQYRGLVERVTRQVVDSRKHVADLGVKVRTYLANGDREMAGQFALELKKADTQLAENDAQLKLHETAYENNLFKVKHASKKVAEVRERIAQYDATLKLSRTEAEISKLAQSLQFDVTTDFGQVEQLVQERIDENRAAVRVAADLSSDGMDDIRRDQEIEKSQAEDALKQFEMAM